MGDGMLEKFVGRLIAESLSGRLLWKHLAAGEDFSAPWTALQALHGVDSACSEIDH